MSATLFRASADRILRRHGEAVETTITGTLRRPHNLASTSRITHTLEVATNAIATATTIKARAPLVGGDPQRLSGQAPAGLGFAIGGVDYVNTVVDRADRESGTDVVTLTIASPGLAAPITAGDVVTLDAYASWTLPAGTIRQGVEAEALAGSDVAGVASYEVLIPDAIGVEPEIGDFIVTGGEELRIVAETFHTAGVYGVLVGRKRVSN